MKGPAPTRLLINCATLSQGGGVQVAAGLLDYLSSQNDVDWTAVLTDKIAPAFSAEVLRSPRVTVWRRGGALGWFSLAARMTLLARRTPHDVMFTVFGPTLAKSPKPHVIGFALPHIIYPEEKRRIVRAYSTAPFKSVINQARQLARDWMQRALFRRADYLVVETPAVADRVSTVLGFPAERVRVFANSLNPRLVRISPSPLVQSSKEFRLLTPSAYYEHKNLEILPEVALHLRSRSPARRFKFCLTISADEPGGRRICDIAERLGVSDAFEFIGRRTLEELAEDYTKSFAVLLPTLLECSTAVYPEAFHFERALITSDRDFARVQCGVAAIYVDPHCPSSWADAIGAVGEDEILRSNLIDQGRAQLKAIYPTSSEKNRRLVEFLSELS